MKRFVLFLAIFLLMAGTAMAEYINLAPVYGTATTNAMWDGHNAGNAIDGDVNTLWVAGTWQNVTTCRWLIVDLSNSFAVDRIVLHDSPLAVGTSWSQTFYLYGSTDGENWNLLRSGTMVDGAGADSLEVTFASTELRYFAYDVTEGPNWAHLNEIMIYGESDRTLNRQISGTESVPEPGTLLLLGLGLVGIAGSRKFKK